jgi:hypothetical protein
VFRPIDVSKQQQDYYDLIKEYGGGELFRTRSCCKIYMENK